MSTSSKNLYLLIGIGAIVGPGLHTLTDIAEWLAGGFSEPQLWANYVAFLILPFVMIGLYSIQRPNIHAWGLAGALLYGASFIYFSHTTLYALTEQVADYALLWERLGITYTLHGVIMILGGIAFGVATFRAGVLPAWAAAMFLAGIVLNLGLAVIQAPEILQTVGSLLRNLGLIGMGFYVLRQLGNEKRER